MVYNIILYRYVVINYEPAAIYAAAMTRRQLSIRHAAVSAAGGFDFATRGFPIRTRHAILSASKTRSEPSYDRYTITRFANLYNMFVILLLHVQCLIRARITLYTVVL